LRCDEGTRECRALKDNDSLANGDAILRFPDAPGHTPDSMCAVVSSKESGEKPLVLLSRDTLFMGSVGRPDLLGENMSASKWASMMFDAWTNKLSQLPDDVIVSPAHRVGSLCGVHLSDEPSATNRRTACVQHDSAAQDPR
jgi:glyoxylase-like metal-dependent hydrolase (beta-lactamase superfamily II)